jgi:hypothetical protein
MIDALGERDFLKYKRWEEADEGYWRITLHSNRCERCNNNGVHSVMQDYTGDVEVCLTWKQYHDGLLAGSVGAVTVAPERVQGGSIQMSNMRHNTPKDGQGGKDGLYVTSLSALWPLITSALVSDERMTDHRSYLTRYLSACCGGTTHRLKQCLWVPLETVQDQIEVLGAERERELVLAREKEALAAEKAAEKAKLSEKPSGFTGKEWYLHTPLPKVDGTPMKLREMVTLPRTDRLASKLPGVCLCLDAMTAPGLGLEADALAVGFGPDAGKCFYANTPMNLAEGIKQRMEIPHVPVTLTADEIAEISMIVAKVVELIESDKLIDEIAELMLFGEKITGLNGDLASKKWSQTRAGNALMQAIARIMPEYQFQAAIKIEPMQPAVGKKAAKPPRVLIADGDVGAVMSAFSLGVLERWTCARFGHQMIKGKAKCDVMEDIVNATEYRPPLHSGGLGEALKGVMLENDGSAWDACCSSFLRELTENQLLDAIYKRLTKYVCPYNAFSDARQKADKKKHIKIGQDARKVTVEAMMGNEKLDENYLYSAMCKKMFRTTILSIRRSGDRGTSILNWWMNKLIWTFVLCGGPNGAKAVLRNAQVLVDCFGTRRRFLFWFEGDDSLIWLSGGNFSELELFVMHEKWVRCGMRPKLFMRTNRRSYDVAETKWTDDSEAEFCGWKFTTNETGLERGTACPDMPRLLANCFYSSDKSAIKAAQSGDSSAFALAVGPALIARAAQIATTCPSVTTWLLNLAASIGDADLHTAEFTRDDMYKLGAEREMEGLLPEGWKQVNLNRYCEISYGSFLDRANVSVSTCLASGGLAREASLAIAHKWVDTADEWNEFLDKLPLINLMTTRAEFEEVLPPRMRK